MYYLNMVLKWEEWLNIPEGTAGWSADVSTRSRPSLRDELVEEPWSVWQQRLHRTIRHCSGIRYLIITSSKSSALFCFTHS